MDSDSKTPSSSPTLDAKMAALKNWGSKINAEDKKKGTGLTVLAAGEILPTPRLATGVPSLDIRLGGGLPRGAITEIYGALSSGKSTLAYQVVAELMRRDSDATAVIIDVEGSYSYKRGAAMGIDPARCRVMHIDTVEVMFDALRDLLREQIDGKPLVDIVVVDSVAALVTEAEDEAAATEFQVGTLARLMSKYIRQFSNIIHKNGQTIIFINQTREKIGVMYGNPETTPGGKALPFYAFSRLRTSLVKVIKDGAEEIGQETKVMVKKAKLDDSVNGETIFLIMKQDGVDTCHDIWRMGTQLGIIDKSGNILTAQTPAGEIKGTGKDAFLTALRANDAARDFLYDEVVKAGVSGSPAAVELETSDEETAEE